MSTVPVPSAFEGPVRWARRVGIQGFTTVESHTGVSGRFPGSHDAVLMYHSVGDPGRFGNVSVERFRRDLEYLTSQFEVVDLADLLEPATTKRVALTFDDAYASFYEHALPLIREFGVPVSVFVPVGFVDGGLSHLDYRFALSPADTSTFNDPEAHRDVSVPPVRMMTTDQLRELAADPLVTLGNHTTTHPVLSAVADRETLEREILGAKREIETRFGVTVDRFCFPYGRYTPEALELVRESHDLAVTTEPDLLDAETDPFQIPRLHGHLPEERLHVDLSDVRWWPRRTLG